MSWGDLGAALALYLVLEGIVPFLSPEGWRRSIAMLARLPDGQIRTVGLVSMLAGVAILWLVRG